MNNSNDPLHGIKLQQILTELEKKVGWEKMGEMLGIRCFLNNPSLKSSLKFLRTTPWARSRVEILYLKTFCSKHKETGKIIRAILAQDNKVAEKPSKNSTGNKPTGNKSTGSKNAPFVWPTAKKK